MSQGNTLEGLEGSPILNGLFDGFEAYRTVPEAELRAALREGLVVVDTNVLLNLYRYDKTAQADLLKVLGALEDRLFVPHQVLVEFWRNREAAVLDRSRTAAETVGRLEATEGDAEGAIRAWANRLAIAESVRDDVLSILHDAFQTVSETVESTGDTSEAGHSHDTEADSLLGALRDLLDGKVGPALDEAEHMTAIKEGLRRVEKKIPPGFKDKSKEGDAAAGDYLVWHQALLEAKRRAPASLVFVTGDTTGDDWWRKEHRELRGPRVELHAEARTVAGTELYMVRPQTLVFHAQAALNLAIGAETVATIERVEQTSQPSDVRIEPVIDAIRDQIHRADRPLVSSAVANTALQVDPTLTDTAWAGTGSFRYFLQTHLPELKFVLPPQPGYVLDPQRHSASDITVSRESYTLAVDIWPDREGASLRLDIANPQVASLLARVTWPSGHQQDSHPIAVARRTRDTTVQVAFPREWADPPPIESGQYSVEFWGVAPFRRYEAGLAQNVLTKLLTSGTFILSRNGE